VGFATLVTQLKWEAPPLLVIPSESADLTGQLPFVRLIYRHQGLVTDLYPTLNDNEELIRLDTLHALMRSLFGRNVIAPIGPLEPNNILDIGAGSGAWALEVAQEYPDTQVIGMDLSPIQRQDVPPNCKFMIGDLTKDLVEFHNGSFDLVHSRLVMAGIREDQWSGYINEIFRILKPGTGWAQSAEGGLPFWDGPVPQGSYYARYLEMVMRRLVESSNCILHGEHLEQRFRDTGFVDINVIKKTWDIGNWRGRGIKYSIQAQIETQISVRYILQLKLFQRVW